MVERLRSETIRQQDNQTCLICCLLLGYQRLTGDSLDFKRMERVLHSCSFGLYPEYFSLSHLAGFTRFYSDVEVEMGVDSSKFAGYLCSLNKERRVRIFPQEISSYWIAEAVEVGDPLLVYVDALHLGASVHLPHWIYILSHRSGVFTIIDTGVGKIRSLTSSQLNDCILGLKYQLFWSPAAVTMKKLP